MKLLCLISFLLININLSAESFAFYYGDNFLEKESDRFDYIVIQNHDIKKEVIDKNKDKFFVYLSICETKEEINKNLIMGYNEVWKSKIADLRKKEYRDKIINKIAEFKNTGFKNFFLDTLDSYIIILKDKKEIEEYQNYIVEIVKTIKDFIPDSKIMINRGFEIMDKLKPYCDYLVAESLYYGFDKNKNYAQINEKDNIWLKNKLNEAKSLGYKIIVIDYIPKTNYSKRMEIARKIKEEGFEPYISNIDLTEWGDNEFEKINRDILVLYDSSKTSDIIYSQAHRLVQMPLEYWGYKTDIKDIKEINSIDIENYYATIFVTENNKTEKTSDLIQFIKNHIRQNKKMLFLGNIPLPKDNYFFENLNINIYKNKSNPGQSINLVKTKYEPFEAPFSYYYSDYILEPKNAEPVILFENSQKQKHYQAAITEWGGYAIDEAWINKTNNYELFTLNPFIFFKKALKLKDIPVLDPTTENGRRILITHIDGDGFNSIYEQDIRFYASEILKKEILDLYKIPHSISIIRGDIDRQDLDKGKQERYYQIAKNIFDLDYVEMANHSYSHPFKWIDIKDINEEEHITQIYNISIPDYKFNLNEEIINTKMWLEKKFGNNNKKNEIFFWTGDCIAPYSALKILNENKMLNINGGYTAITKDAPYISLIAPLGIKRTNYYQIFSAQQNENIYTNLWTGPFWGYKKAKETFELTDHPLRLKPINIYYHFYSASKNESLKALKYIYDYSINQKTNPQFASEYVKKVLDFYDYEVYNYKNEWIIISDSNSKTIRIDKELFTSVGKDSSAGYQSEKNSNYLHLKNKSPYKLILTKNRPLSPYLKNSNAKIEKFEFENNYLNIELSSWVKIEYELGNMERCKIKEKNYQKNKKYIKEIYGECN